MSSQWTNSSDFRTNYKMESQPPKVQDVQEPNKEVESTEPPQKAPRMQKQQPQPQQQQIIMPLEVIQTLQQLSSPKLSNSGVPTRPQNMRFEDGRPILPEMGPLQQCQQLQQILGLIQFHEQQVKYRSYMQLELLRNLRKQLSDQMMLHPQRHHYEALVEAAKNNRLTPLSIAERAQLEYFTSMAEWTLEARVSLERKLRKEWGMEWAGRGKMAGCEKNRK